MEGRKEGINDEKGWNETKIGRKEGIRRGRKEEWKEERKGGTKVRRKEERKEGWDERR